MKPKRALMLILALGLGLCVTQQAVADEDDPPGRVARLGYLEGSVSFEPAGTEDWLDAEPNRPITLGDRLWADEDSRAELHIGSAAIRLADRTGFSFLDLADDVVQIQLTEGAISIHLQDLYENETFEIDTPNLAFTLLRPGDYRIEVNEAGDATIVSVRRGQGEVTGGGRSFSVRSNQRAAFIGTEQLDSFIDEVGDDDAFDRWCHDRDLRESNSISARYVSRGVIGYEDLDDYGDWRTVSEYGPIWVPRHVEVGWAPYRHGHWTWISPWGWTWMDDAPWGFAPFHYGRWAYVGGVWGWCPGPRVTAGVIARPVYAPALVAWVGGPNFSLGVSIGGGSLGVAWFPLAPREVYVPPYRVSRAYVTNVNITNTVVNNVTITNIYENPRTNNVRYVNRTAVTATSRTAFASAQPVASNIVRVEPAQMTRAQVTTNVGVMPQEKSVVGASRRAAVKPPVEIRERKVVARTTPPPAPVPFARQRHAIEANGGRPLGRREAERLEPQRTQPPAPVKVEKPAASPVPVESVARPESESPNRPSPRRGPRGRTSYRPSGRTEERATQEKPPSPVPAPNQPPASTDRPSAAEPENRPNQPKTNRPDRPDRPGRGRRAEPLPNDRPPSAQPENRPSEPDANRPESPDQPGRSPREEQLDQVHQQEQEKLSQQQEQQRRLLEQKHQEQQRRSQQPGENRQQQLEHQKLQQQQEQQRLQLKQKQQQERQRLLQGEGRPQQQKKPRGQKKPPPEQ